MGLKAIASSIPLLGVYNSAMRRGIVFLNGYKLIPSLDNSATRLTKELASLGVELVREYSTSFHGYIDENGMLTSKPYDADFIIYLDKDKYISSMLEKMGYRLFNSSHSIEVCDDKMLTHLVLASSGIKMPKTLSGPLNYSGKANDVYVDTVLEELGLPVVVKANFGSMGAGVYLASSKEELISLETKLNDKPRLYQQLISSSYGKDFRLILVGGKVVAAMERESLDGDFRSNIGLGGKGKVIDVPQSFVKVAEKAARIIGLDYCGIDLLLGEHNEPILCEVNSNAFFEGIEEVTGINVAKAYAEYIVSKVY